MRNELKELFGQTLFFTGRVRDFKKDYFENSKRIYNYLMLLRDVKCNDKLVAEHLWVIFNNVIKDGGRGSLISFRADVRQYVRGKKFKDFHLEYGLSNIKRVKVIEEE